MQYSSNSVICRCESTNGINWSNFSLNVPVGAQGVYDTTYNNTPCILIDNYNLLLYYVGSNGTTRIIRAIATS